MKKCTGCGAAVEPLAEFPGARCLRCYEKGPEAQAFERLMRVAPEVAGRQVAKMWGAK